MQGFGPVQGVRSGGASGLVRVAQGMFKPSCAAVVGDAAMSVVGRRRFIRQALCLGALPGLAGCMADDPLRVASHAWPGYELMFLAAREGWLAPDEARLVETPSASASLAALAAGQVDAAALTLDEVLLARARGQDLSIVLVVDISNGADVLLARAHLQSLSALAGLRVGVETSAVGALMLHHVLRAAGLERSQVEIVPATADTHERLWTSGAVDALISFEPTAARLEARGARRLFDSRAIPETIFDVLAIRNDRVRARESGVEALLRGHFRALAHLRHNPLDAAYRMAARLGLKGPEVLEVLSVLEFPDLAMNRLYLGATQSPFRDAVLRVQAVMLEAGLLERADDMQRLVTDRFLPRRPVP